MKPRVQSSGIVANRIRSQTDAVDRSAVPSDQLQEIAANVYIYAYALVMMDVTKRVGTNVETASGMDAPVNQFAHLQTFPDSTFTNVVRPNADTLYSSLFFDVSKEPLVITLPDSGGRYHLLQIMDAWTEVFASPGTRTTGDGPITLALTGPGWSGRLPGDIYEIKAPTSTGWIIGRTRTDGKADYANVHTFQAGITATPLSSYGKSYTPPKGRIDPTVKETPPVDQIEQMSPSEFFECFSNLIADNPPHANDYPILHQMERLGFVIGEPFDLAEVDADTRAAFEQAPAIALKKIKAKIHQAGFAVNGWRTNLTAIGTYGADYLSRAGVAYAGLGANTVEDAIYPTAITDADGKFFDSSSKYILHFNKEQIPPVRGFWSLTMYNDRQFFADNPISRYAIGDRDNLKFNSDGSLDLYIQRESPGSDKENNWLPTPGSGGFTMNMRLYWPKAAALEGTWNPPAVQKAN